MTRTTKALGLACSLAVLSAVASAASPVADNGYPFRINRISDRVAVFQSGTAMEDACVTVISTEKGLIVVDTGGFPTLAEQLKKKIKEVFGRDDVLYVVNTHEHIDHTGGNQAFAGSVIIGHRNAVPAIRKMADNKDAVYAAWRPALAQAPPEGQDPKSEEAVSQAEMARWVRGLLADRDRFVPTPPAKTFDDRLTLAVDDLKLEFYYFGPAHTDNDILLHIPKLGLLFVGDLFHPTRLSALASPGLAHDVPRWLDVLGRVLGSKDELKTVIGGHGHIYSLEWMDVQYRYMKDLWAGVTAAKKSGLTQESFLERNSLDQGFSYVGRFFDVKSEDVINRHAVNVRTFWRVGQASAANELAKVMNASGIEPARRRFAELQKDARSFYLDEREMNALGYRLMQGGKLPEAVAVFEMNTVAFPQSWNVWDSLGEASMFDGDFAQAETCYARSVELNPGNVNGKDSLSRVRGYKLDARGETKEPSKWQAGEPTGLQGPYMGQEPPGLEPRVFAPGIVSTAGNTEFGITFSPDAKEMYFTRRKLDGGQNAVLVSRWGKDGWTAPEEAPFSKGFPTNEPHVTPDGKRLYFGSVRPLPGRDTSDYGIWSVERTADGAWSAPAYFGPGMYVSASRAGDLYMSDITMSAGGGIVRYPAGAMAKPEKLGGGVNSPRGGDHAFIAPDASFIVFDSYFRPGGQGGEGDLYVCFRKTDGTWTEAFNLGDKVNTPATNFCPSLSPDGKFLFFSTYRDIYWVSADVIEKVRPQEAQVKPAPAAFDPKRTYPPEGLKADLRILWDMLEEGHAGLDRYTPAADLKKSFDNAVNGIAGPMTVLDFYVKLLPLIAEIKDGHTRAQLPAEAAAWFDEQPVSFPLGLRLLGNKAYVFRNLSANRGIKDGAELLSINGKPMTEILSNLVALMGNDAGIRTRPVRMLEFPATFGRLFALRYGVPETFRIRLRPLSAGPIEEITVPGIAGKDVVPTLYKRYPEAAKQPPMYELTYRGTTAVLTIRAFADGEENGSLRYLEFLRAAFRDFAEKKTPDLVIDLRTNGGGRDEYAKMLFAYVADQPFTYYSALESKRDRYDLFKFTDESEANQKEFAAHVKKNARGWYDVLGHPNVGPQQPAEPHFAGRVAILIGGLSFSATGETTSMFHFHKKAVFFGEECGAGYYGNTSGFSVQATLPNTKIKVRIPLVIYVMAVDGYPQDRGIVPDFPVTPTIEDLLAGRDPVMDRALKFLNEK